MQKRYKKNYYRNRRGFTKWLILFIFFAAAAYVGYLFIFHPEGLNPEIEPAFAEVTDNITLGEDERLTPEDLTVNDDNKKFSVVPYYIEDMLPEYISYYEENTDLNYEEVVWMVNAGLDRKPYMDYIIINDPNPLVVNPYNRLQESFEPVSLEEIDANGRLATRETIDAFNEFRQGAQRNNLDIAVQSAYRTIEYQQMLYDRAGSDGSVAKPMFSEHHTGRALDLWGPPSGLLDETGPSDTGRWVAANAYKYGFIIRYTEENSHITHYISEPWHITYVGKDIAKEMKDGNYGSLEEYAAKNPDARLP
jgi:D-alanyl-D-alanine carboxypeptidase